MSDRRRARLDAVLARRQPDLTVFAENLHKTRNFSAMVRTCDAVGINEVHVYQEEQGLQTGSGSCVHRPFCVLPGFLSLY